MEKKQTTKYPNNEIRLSLAKDLLWMQIYCLFCSLRILHVVKEMFVHNVRPISEQFGKIIC